MRRISFRRFLCGISGKLARPSEQCDEVASDIFKSGGSLVVDDGVTGAFPWLQEDVNRDSVDL